VEFERNNIIFLGVFDGTNDGAGNEKDNNETNCGENKFKNFGTKEGGRRFFGGTI